MWVISLFSACGCNFKLRGGALRTLKRVEISHEYTIIPSFSVEFLSKHVLVNDLY